MPLRIEGAISTKLMRKMKSYRKIVPIQAIQIEDDFVIVQRGGEYNDVTGELTAVRGTWLAMGPNGGLYPIPDDVFQAQYVPVEEVGDG